MIMAKTIHQPYYDRKYINHEYIERRMMRLVECMTGHYDAMAMIMTAQPTVTVNHEWRIM
jgi:hypothetical protein